jgi:DNA-directed RNA polymerase subunit RPC12/RpoP
MNMINLSKAPTVKFVCFECRKSFKRSISTGLDELDPPKCPECSRNTSWIGQKFRPPKITNIRAWKSIKLLSEIGLLDLGGVGGDKSIEIPESTQKLKSLLLESKEHYECQIRKCISSDYSKGNKENIKCFNKTVLKINLALDRLK